MVELSKSGEPVICSGCRAPIEQVTPDMHHPVPVFLSRALLDCVGLTFVVCAPLPDGRHPCLEQAILLHAIAGAGFLAHRSQPPQPPRTVVGCVPAYVADALADVGWPDYGPVTGHQRVVCAGCRCPAWSSPRARRFQATHPGMCVRLCIPCAFVEFATHDTGWAYTDVDQEPWERLLDS